MITEMTAMAIRDFRFDNDFRNIRMNIVYTCCKQAYCSAKYKYFTANVNKMIRDEPQA